MSDRAKAPRPPLPVPVERVLEDGADELTLERTWRRVAATREADHAPGGRLRVWRMKRLVPVGVFVAAAVVAAQPLSQGLAELWRDAEETSAAVGLPEPSPPSAPAPSVPPSVAPSPASPVAPEEASAPAPAPAPAPSAELRTPEPVVVRRPRPAASNADGARAEASAPGPVVPTPPAWAERWRTGDLDGALAAVGPEGFAGEVRRNRSVDELFLLADLARVAGRPDDALSALERVGELHPGAPWGGLAAFTAGKLKLESTRDPAGAAEAFSRALQLGLPEALAAQAVARREEALRRVGGAD